MRRSASSNRSSRIVIRRRMARSTGGRPKSKSIGFITFVYCLTICKESCEVSSKAGRNLFRTTPLPEAEAEVDRLSQESSRLFTRCQADGSDAGNWPAKYSLGVLPYSGSREQIIKLRKIDEIASF